jgi:Ni,Fe-hydrogenase III component G
MPAGHGYVLTLSLAQLSSLPSLCRFLFLDRGCQFGGMIAEEHSSQWQLHYAFLLPGSGWIDVLLSLPIETTTVPSIVAEVNAADWHEREVEDMFGIHFEGHPRLGDFVLHDQSWREGIEPMRKRFSANEPAPGRQLDLEWEPQLIVADPGSFAMPVGPISLMKVKGTDMLGCACCSRKQPSQ